MARFCKKNPKRAGYQVMSTHWVRFNVPNSYTNYRPNKLPLLLATWCETKYYTNHQY